ncbi:MAG TPA: response regulator [Gemmatimonadaceae bacterium]|jgi:two-component system alkaline phosphatase synthesis response regulator PhoP
MTEATRGRILIIDDDDDVRSAHQRLLERAGYDVRTSRSPYEGLDLAREWPPDLVMLDLMMPTVSGFEAVKVFRKRDSTKGAFLVAFSGMITESELDRFKRIGFDEILPKPVRPEELAVRIGSFLTRHRASAAPNR